MPPSNWEAAKVRLGLRAGSPYSFFRSVRHCFTGLDNCKRKKRERRLTWCRWLRRRSGFLARHLAQYNKKPTHRRCQGPGSYGHTQAGSRQDGFITTSSTSTTSTIRESLQMSKVVTRELGTHLEGRECSGIVTPQHFLWSGM